MKNKILNYVCVLLCIIININIATATVLYDNTIEFPSSGSYSATNTKTISTNSGTVFYVAISNLTVDFTTYKNINYMLLRSAVGYWTSGSHCSPGCDYIRVTTFTSSTNITQKATPVSIYVDGIWYGTGTIGWKKYPPVYTSTDFDYEINLDTVNTSYAAGLSGSKSVTTVYDHSVFDSYINNYSVFNTYGNYGSGGIISTDNAPYMRSIYFEYDSSGSERITLTNTTSKIFGYLNITKNNANFRNNITNSSGWGFYDTTSTDDISEYVDFSNGVIDKITDMASSETRSVTVYTPTSEDIIQFDNVSYASTSGMNFSWSIGNMNPAFGYIASLYDFNGVLMDAYSIISATGSQTIDRSSLSMIGEYTIKLIQIDDTSSPVIRTELDSDTAYWGSLQTNISTPVSGNFSIHNSPVMQGSKVNITYNITTEGWLELYDWTSTIRFDIDAGTNKNIEITIPENYKVGTNSIRLRYADRFTDQNILLWLQTYTVLPSLNYSLTSDRALYNQGELMKYYPYSSTDGYAKIVSPSGIMVNNISITAYGSHVLSYQSDINSEVGTYTASLFNASGLLTTKGIYLNYGMQSVTPTATATATETPVTLIDIASELSTGLLGTIDSNEDGLNSNDELSGFGNKILSTLVLIVLALLISGIFANRKR